MTPKRHVIAQGVLKTSLLNTTLGEKQCALRCKVASFHGYDAAIAYRAVLQNLCFYQFESAVCVTQENQAQHGHAVLI